MKQIEECINGFFSEVQNRKSVNYGSKVSVKRYNAAYERCFGYIKYIDDHYPEHLDVLIELLEHPDQDVVLHCAPMIFRLDHSTKELKLKAIQAFEKLLSDSRIDEVDRFIIAVNLREWHQCLDG